MFKCWACNSILKDMPDEFFDPEGEEEPDIVTTCPECLTRHVYTENSDGNLYITQAVKIDGSVLRGPSSRPSRTRHQSI
jgi:hypothetical protein